MNKIISVLSMALLFSLSSCIMETEVNEYSTIIFYIGDVKKNNKEIEIGDIILQNDIIITGVRSSCDIKIGGSIIRVKEKSNIMLSELTGENNIEKTTIGLGIGKILCRAKKLSKSEHFLVKTPTAVAGVRGTKFSVEADAMKTSRIKVFTGKVNVAKRIKQFKDKIEKILEIAPTINEEEKVIITADAVKETEKIVEKAIKKELKSSKSDLDATIVKIIKELKNDVVVTKKDIKKFKIDDFKKENREIIEIKEKPKEIIKEIKTIVKLEKKEPVPEGRLLITRYEIHFIKNGRPLWEGKVINPPIQQKEKLYIASGDYVFCASLDGPVFWKRNIKNEGRIEIKDDKLIVFAKGKTKKLDLVTGK